MGYNRNMPKEVVYGPEDLGGLGLHDLYVEQGIKQISTLIGHVRQGSDTGRMMLIQLEWCQVQAGTVDDLLQSPTAAIDYIETCWIMSIRDFLRTYKLQIHVPAATRPKLQCNHDEFIMDALRMRGKCTAVELQSQRTCATT
jgi:hypothetical protein